MAKHLNVNLQFKLLNECEFNIDGIEYEMNSIKTTQYVDCNGNGLFYGNVNEYNNPLTLKKASSSSLRKKKTLLSLHNIKVYPEIPLINVNLVDNDEIMFNRSCIVLYEHQLCELVFDVTNIGRYNVDYIKASVYVYKREDYKIMLKAYNKRFNSNINKKDINDLISVWNHVEHHYMVYMRNNHPEIVF